jgi:hypothetical protein
MEVITAIKPETKLRYLLLPLEPIKLFISGSLSWYMTLTSAPKNNRLSSSPHRILCFFSPSFLDFKIAFTFSVQFKIYMLWYPYRKLYDL